MRNYKEYLRLRSVGNISSVRHVAAGGGWTRTYNYASIATNNQLTSTQVRLAHRAVQLRPAREHDVDVRAADAGLGLQGPVADHVAQFKRRRAAVHLVPLRPGGKRVRKISFSAAGIPQSERIYFGNYEIYRTYSNTGTLTLERQTVIVPDGAKHLALVETSYDKTKPGAKPVTAIRYQFSNHLGSACLELDEQAAVLTYEEYFPYGATSFIAGHVSGGSKPQALPVYGQGTRLGKRAPLPRCPLLRRLAGAMDELRSSGPRGRA